MQVKEMKITEKDIMDLKNRNLTDYYPIFTTVPEEKAIVVVFSTEGLLVVPESVPILVVDNVKVVDEWLIQKLRKLAKLHTIYRIVWGLNNEWEFALEKIREYDLYAFTHTQDGYLFIDNMKLDDPETSEYFKKFLNAKDEPIPATIYFYSKKTNERLGQKFSVMMWERGTIDQLIEEEKARVERVKNEYPETFEIVKNVYNI